MTEATDEKKSIVLDDSTSPIFVDPKKKPKKKEKKKVPLIVKILLVIFGIILLGVIAASIFAYTKISEFEEEADIALLSLLQELQEPTITNVYGEDQQLVIAVAGIDEIKGQREDSLLTDTMMLASVKPDGNIAIISIPRDIWIPELELKINSVYLYGDRSEETTGHELFTKILKEITGVTIDKHIVVSLDFIKQVIDTMGGIDVDVQRAFVDEKFPRTDVDIETETDEARLYKTISFEQGIQRFDGETALEFIRSRNSKDDIEGTDIGRSMRQQQVVRAIIARAQTTEVITNPTTVGKLYNLWANDLTHNITNPEIIALAKELYNKEITIKSSTIPTETDEDPGLLTNPPVNKYGLWVWEPYDTSWQGIKDWVAKEFE